MRGLRRWLVALVVAVLVNLPAVHEGWTDRQVAADGRDVAGVVLDARPAGDGYLVEYLLPVELDPAQTRYAASVDLETYQAARSSERIAVRVIPGRPDANRPDGLVASSLFTVIALTGDAVLLVIGALLWWRRRHPSSVDPDDWNLGEWDIREIDPDGPGGPPPGPAG